MAKYDTKSNRIKRVAEGQNIHRLLHFTLLKNLSNIVQHGILPREELNAVEFDAYTGTQNRLDDNDQAVSLSISAASQNIFNAKTRGTSEEDWVILFLDPCILWNYDCRFFFCNAASRELQYYRKNRYLGGPWALERMFSDKIAPPTFEGMSYRAETGIPTFLTTDPDAEVQVSGRIEPEKIVGAWAYQRDQAEVVQSELDRLSGQERDVLSCEFITESNGYADWIVHESML